ncbi:hypothetical protein E2562_029325 [Oryza meyeriana var. granulata]|uniref:Myb/SANT-like domain-containing protein n=1 Tax=Oryza meyeriana var. granulata TaxID=110450 RepID=A0A6G1E3L6_9ORYZ|nr:hypothetical protein E2562_029325 [Oryza meyeriana var. granulata]
MDGDDFDNNFWGSQPSATGPAHAPAGRGGFDLNSQASAAEGFPRLQLYGDILQGDDNELLPARVRGSGHPPYRPPRAGAGDARATPAAPYARQLHFGGSSSAATGRGGGSGAVFPGGSSSGAGGPVRQRANSAAAAPGRRTQRTSTELRGSGGHRVPRYRAPRAPSTRAVRGQASGSGAPFDNDDAAMEDDVEELASSGGPPQRRAGRYNGAQMSGEGYQAVVDGLLARRRLVYTRGQKKPYLKRLLSGPPGNEDLLDELFRGYTVDGTTAFVPGDDYGDNEGQDAGIEDEDEEFQATPTSTSNQRSQKGKRALSSTTSTLTSPVKKSKSPMVRIVKDIATTFKESVAANTKQIQQRADEKAAFSVQRCQQLAFECGVEKTVDSVYAMSKMFATQYQREFFCGQLTPELRLGYFKKWKKIMAP